MKTSKLITTGAAIFLGTSLLTGCGAPAGPLGSPSASSSSVSTSNWQGSFYGLPRINMDLVVFNSNKELANGSEFVITGTVEAVRDGAQYGNFDDGFSDIKSIVFELKVNKVIKGELLSGESVYFRMPMADGIDASVWQKAIPSGTPMVSYLHTIPPAAPGEVPGFQVTDKSAGIPENGKLLSISPQGFALQVAPDTLYWPFSEVTHNGTLEDALPDGPAHGSPVSKVAETENSE